MELIKVSSCNSPNKIKNLVNCILIEGNIMWEVEWNENFDITPNRKVTDNTSYEYEEILKF